MMKSTEDFVAFGQAELEAFEKSGQIWSAGVQELTKQMAASAKASFDESVSTFKAISSAKSVKEAMELQSTFAKAALEKAMAESNKLTDASIKLTEETLAPITARVTQAVEQFASLDSHSKSAVTETDFSFAKTAERLPLPTRDYEMGRLRHYRTGTA